MSSIDASSRVISAMRPTGRLHLGHYHGVLKQWVELQHLYECFFFVADWHALTTHYEQPFSIEESVYEMVIDWLAAGIKPGAATLFIQSRVPEQAELHLLLSMITPLAWLERVPAFKDRQDALKEQELATYGFLGYPLLQSADILAYRAGLVPIGGDQLAHVEVTRQIARRFNHLYGREPDFEANVEAAIRKMGKKTAKLYYSLRRRYLEHGEQDALDTARALIKEQLHISLGDRERLLGYLEGGGKVILPEPLPLLSAAPKVPGLDGQKMSKSRKNAIGLREKPDSVVEKIRTMQTDPARVRRNDPGDPEKCPVWKLHEVYSGAETKQWVQQGCRFAGIGCLDCKKPVIDAVLEEQKPILERARPYEENPNLVKSILAEGCEVARDEAKSTLEEVRRRMDLEYF